MTIKVHGVVLITADKDDPLQVVPVDGSNIQFYTLNEVPPAVALMATDLADANEVTALGVIADLGA